VKLPRGFVPCFGLFFKIDHQDIFITADTTFTPDYLMPYYEKANIIFHDCELSAVKSGVHAHFSELDTLPESIKNKMWLYHYQDIALPDAKKHGFKGFVKQGQSFNF